MHMFSAEQMDYIKKALQKHIYFFGYTEND
jgi:hypothetical protein